MLPCPIWSCPRHTAKFFFRMPGEEPVAERPEGRQQGGTLKRVTAMSYGSYGSRINIYTYCILSGKLT